MRHGRSELDSSGCMLFGLSSCKTRLTVYQGPRWKWWWTLH